MDEKRDDKRTDEPARRTWWGLAAAVMAVALWGTSVFAHDFAGREIFGRFFSYAKATWGPDGRARAELIVLGGALAIAGVVVLSSLAKILARPAGRRAAPELGARWAAALLFALAANRYLICLQSEDVHFAQYGFVAFFLALWTRNPRFAFLATAFLGFVDEAYQWWFLYRDVTDLHLDWTDMILDACGAAVGALPFTSFARIHRYEQAREDVHDVGPRLPVVAGMAVLMAALSALVFGPYLGQYSTWPAWYQLDNLKPHHVLTLREGVPAVLAVVYLLHAVVDERTRTLPVTAVLGLILGLHVAVTPPQSPHDASALAEPIHAPGIPQMRVPHAKAPPKVDGTLDDAEWEGAATVELGSFAPTANATQRGWQPQVYGPTLETKARLLWDEKALYVGFACVTTDVWTKKGLERDDPAIAQTPCVEVFLDLDTAERSYYEFEVNAANQVQDLFVYWPEPPQWAPNPHSVSFVGLNRWSSPAFRSAVAVQGGACDVVEDPNQTRALPPTRGYSVELAIPWEDLRGRAVWDHSANGGAGAPAPPTKGTFLRANLYRIELRRPWPGLQQDAYQAWAPVHAPLDFHRPHYFGILELD